MSTFFLLKYFFLLQNLFHLHLRDPLPSRLPPLQIHNLALRFHPISRKFQFLPPLRPSLCYHLLFSIFLSFSSFLFSFSLLQVLFFSDSSNSDEEQT